MRDEASLRYVRVRLSVGLAVLFAGAACAGQSCSCLAPIPGGFNPSQRVPNAVQARVGSQGIQYIQANINSIINAFIPGGLSQAVPCTHASGADICCGANDNCAVQVGLNSVALNPTPPNLIGLNIRATIKTQSGANRAQNFLTAHSLGTDCGVSLDTTRNAPVDLGIQGSFALQAPADPVTDLTSVNVTVDTIADLQDNDIDITNRGGILGAVVCGVANLGIV